MNEEYDKIIISERINNVVVELSECDPDLLSPSKGKAWDVFARDAKDNSVIWSNCAIRPYKDAEAYYHTAIQYFKNKN